MRPGFFLSPSAMPKKTKHHKKAAKAKPPAVDSVPEQTPPPTTPDPMPANEPPPASPIVPEPVSASDLVGPIVAGMPEPTNSPLGEIAGEPASETPPQPSVDPDRRPAMDNPEKYFSGEGTPAPQPPPFVAGEVDDAGTVFDPAKHMADETGRPKKNSLGRFYSKFTGRGGRAGAGAKPGKPDAAEGQAEFAQFTDAGSGPVPPGAIPVSGVGDRFDLAAELYCRTGYGIAVTAFSDEGWQPENKAEHDALRSAVANYLRATNREELPPSVALLLAVGAFAGKRVSRPKTSERLKMFWIWFRVRVLKQKPQTVVDPDDAVPGDVLS